MIRVGVIGMGAIGNTHAECYADDALAELVAVCDIVNDRAVAGGERFGVPSHDSAQAMLEAHEIDAVSVCSGGQDNGGDHYLPVMEALGLGRHVLCEKPLCNDVALAREMVLKADEQGLCLGTNLNHRFVPFAWKAKDWVLAGDEGRIGRLLYANMILRIENPVERSPFFHFRALHPHSLDVLNLFMGEAQAVHCFATRPPERVCWSNLSMNIEYESGAIGHVSGSYDAGARVERCEVAGTNGRFVIEDVCESLTYYARRGSGKVVRSNPEVVFDSADEVFENPPEGEAGHTAGFRGTFTNRIHHWLEQLTDRVPPKEIEASGRAGLRVQEIIEAAIKSFQTRTVVEL